MIKILPPEAWREFRGTPPNMGLNQTTHLATIADETGKLHKCFVKLVPSDWPTPLTEAIAWLISDSLDIPRPEFAAIVFLPVAKLSKYIALDQHWLRYEIVPAFCSEAVSGKSPIHFFKWVTLMNRRRIYKRPEVARISAFDQWLENQDRHSGNLIVKKSGECVPIDNEFILYSVLWSTLLNVQQQSLLNESAQYLDSESHTRFLVEMAQSSQLHQSALATAAKGLENTIRALVPNPQTADSLCKSIYDFLSTRAQSDWMSNHLGVIA